MRRVVVMMKEPCVCHIMMKTEIGKNNISFINNEITSHREMAFFIA